MTDESPKQRVDRELIELLNELRVALPGVQVLFAFLLAVPFQQRFAQATSLQRDIYFGTLCAALVATALLIAPSSLHRLNFRRHDKTTIIAISNWLVIAGLAVLAIAMVGVIALISDVVFGVPVSIIAPVVATVTFGLLWVALPLRLRSRPEVDGSI